MTRFTTLKIFVLFAALFCSNQSIAQCQNFTTEHFDSFEYVETCPYIVPNTTYQSTPMDSPTYGPSHSGSRHLYLNFIDNFTGIAFSRPYTTCVGGTYRISFYHKDAWGGTNQTTFNIYDATNLLVHSANVSWSGDTWNHWVSPEIVAATTTLRLEIVNNGVNLGNNDMSVDDMTLEICGINEQRSLLTCIASNPTNLFTLFSNQMPTNGTWNGPSTLSNGHLGLYDPSSGVEGVYTYTATGSSTCGTPQGTVTVSGGSPIDLGPDIDLCLPQNVTLDAGSGYDFYEWSTGSQNQTITVNTSGTYSVKGGKLGQNLVLNGDFQGGTTSSENNFTSNYIPGTGGSWGLLSNPGQFAISTSPSNTHGNFYSCQDHTTGSTNMFIANGAQQPNTTVWTQTISISPNQDYRFSYWVMNVTTDPNVSSLQLYINGQAIGTTSTTNGTPCIWTQNSDTWNSGSATQAVLSIINQSTDEGGNDFALDDIEFAPYCLFEDTITVHFASQTLSLTPNTTICEGSSINLIANATSLTPTNFIYTWNTTSSTSNTQTVSPLTTTTYSVFATDTNGCSTPPKQVTISVAPMPQPNAGIDQTVCIGSPINLTGTIGNIQNTRIWSHNTNQIVGTPTLTYFPNTGSLNTSINTNIEGVYNFILTEQNTACGQFRDTVQVTVSKTTQQITTNNTQCFGSPTGSISIINPDGIQYSFNNALSWTTNADSTNLSSGQYIVWSQNQYGCKSVDSVFVGQPAALMIQANSDTTICQNGTATFQASASNGLNNTYHWSHTTDVNSTQLIQTLNTTTYRVFAEDANGCLSDTAEITLTVLPALSATISDTIRICPQSEASIHLTGITGGKNPYSIVWSEGSIGSGENMTILVEPAQSQTYTVTISDACESTPITLSTRVIVAPLPVPSLMAPIVELCEPAIFELINTTDTLTMQSNQWIVSNGQVEFNRDSIATESLLAGDYTVSLIVVSPEGCIDTTTYSNLLKVHPLPVADFIWNPSPIRMFSTEVNFTNTSENAELYAWQFTDGVPKQSTEFNPKVKFPEGTTGEYPVQLIATTTFGCSDTLEKTIIVLPEVIIYVPNTFTPDGDEFNQNWKVVIDGIDMYEFELEVYNRWGEMVWESKDPSYGWDGTYKGAIVQDGTYSWLIRAKDKLNDDKYTWNGNLNLLR